MCGTRASYTGRPRRRRAGLRSRASRPVRRKDRCRRSSPGCRRAACGVARGRSQERSTAGSAVTRAHPVVDGTRTVTDGAPASPGSNGCSPLRRVVRSDDRTPRNTPASCVHRSVCTSMRTAPVVLQRRVVAFAPRLHSTLARRAPNHHWEDTPGCGPANSNADREVFPGLLRPCAGKGPYGCDPHARRATARRRRHAARRSKRRTIQSDYRDDDHR